MGNRAVRPQPEITTEDCGELTDRAFFTKHMGLVFQKKQNQNKDERMRLVKTMVDGSEMLPEAFKCPITKQLMNDPVIIASGQTFERSAIVNWRKAGNRTCPLTNEFLKHEQLTPNYLLKKLISDWGKNHGLQETEQKTFYILNVQLSSKYATKTREAAKELCQLTKEKSCYGALYAKNSQCIDQLFHLLVQSLYAEETDPGLHEDVFTIVLNILTDEKSKKAVAERPLSILFLIRSLYAKEMENRFKAAAAIYQMSLLGSNKELLGNSGVLKPLIELLKAKESSKVTQEAAKAISSLCEYEGNVKIAMELRAVFVVTEKLVDRIFIEDLLSVLARLSFHKPACEELESIEFVPVLLSILRENHSDVSNENATLILHNIIEKNWRVKKEMLRRAKEHMGTIIDISKSGTLQAKI